LPEKTGFQKRSIYLSMGTSFNIFYEGVNTMKIVKKIMLSVLITGCACSIAFGMENSDPISHKIKTVLGESTISTKILVISTSLRKDSNTDILADEFARGALSSGHEVEKISLIGKKINYCLGCDVCQKTQRCVLQDDATEIVKKIHEADVIVFAAPVYFG